VDSLCPRKRKDPAEAGSFRLLSLRQQRGWEKFFTVKQRGIRLFVISFTYLSYQRLLDFATLLFNCSRFCHKLSVCACLADMFSYDEIVHFWGDIMRSLPLVFWLAAVIVSFFLNLFGLMRLFPLFLTMPLLFVTILCTLWTLNNRNRFKGFQKRMW